jgi:hypothetical protein
VYEEEVGNGVDFDALMHWVETAGPGRMGEHGVIEGLREGAASGHRGLFSAKTNPAYTAWENVAMREKTMRFAESLKKMKQGRIHPLVFQEAISTSDFPQLTTNLLSWRLLALYTQAENIWESIVDVNDTIPDFRNIQVTRMWGLDTPMPKVAQLADYQMDAPSAIDRQYNLAKYGRKFAMSWEAKLNDWLRMFDKVPQALANGARNTENLFVTGLLAAAAGPNPLLFSTDGSTNGATGNTGAVLGPINEIVGAAATFNQPNLQAAYTAMSSQVTPNGNPLQVKPRYLVVPAALKMQAEAVLNAQFLIASNITTSGSTPALVPNVNVMQQNPLTIIENRWLPAVDKSGNVNKTWYLVADPAAGGAPIEVGFLMGHRQPELFRQSPNQESISGAGATPDDGDFENDAMQWKVRHVMGGIDVEPLYAFAFVGA